jgi:hypothetical protein
MQKQTKLASEKKQDNNLTEKQVKALKKFNKIILKLLQNLTKSSPDCQKCQTSKLQYETFIAKDPAMQRITLLTWYTALRPHTQLINPDTAENQDPTKFQENLGKLVNMKLPLFEDLLLYEKWHSYNNESKANLGQFVKMLWTVMHQFTAHIPNVEQEQKKQIEEMKMKLPEPIQEVLKSLTLSEEDLRHLINIFPESLKQKFTEKIPSLYQEFQANGPAQIQVKLIAMIQELSADMSEEQKQSVVSQLSMFLQSRPQIVALLQQNLTNMMNSGNFGALGNIAANFSQF